MVAGSLAAFCNAMQDKSLTTIKYAIGGSFLAIGFIYILGPTIFADYEQNEETVLQEKPFKNGIVGLSNTGNDCFSNSVLQALAGLSNLRDFITRELHERSLFGHQV